MRMFEYLRKSIGLTQAAVMLVSSLLIGLVLSAVHLTYNLVDQRKEVNSLTQEILTAAEGGATNAAWTLDMDLADQVVNSMMALSGVQAVTLMDERGNVLVQESKPIEKHNRFTFWFSHTFIGDEAKGQRDLSVSVGDSELRKVGVLSVELVATQLAGNFLSLALTVLMTGLVQALLIALVLLWLSSRLVTLPLQRAASAIADIDPEQAIKTSDLERDGGNYDGRE